MTNKFGKLLATALMPKEEYKNIILSGKRINIRDYIIWKSNKHEL